MLYKRGASCGAVSVFLSVCLSLYHLSQVRVLAKRLNELSWFFGMGVSFDLSYTVFEGNLGVELCVFVSATVQSHLLTFRSVGSRSSVATLRTAIRFLLTRVSLLLCQDPASTAGAGRPPECERLRSRFLRWKTV